MTIESALTYFLAIFVFAVTPGPGIFALLAKGMSAGTRPCIPLALGMTVSDVIYRSHRAKPERYVSGGGLNAGWGDDGLNAGSIVCFLCAALFSIGARSERHQPYRRLADGSGRCFSRCERVSRAA